MPIGDVFIDGILICVLFVRWGTSLSDKIYVTRGTRQGGLASPFIFNLFYKELIE